MVTPTLTEIGKVLRELAPAAAHTKLQKIAPSGSLVARKQQDGAILFYWRWSLGEASDRELIGFYDSSAPPMSVEPTNRGYSIKAAIRRAEDMAGIHRQNKKNGGWPAIKAVQDEKRKRENEERNAATTYTLSRLCDGYADHIQSLKRDAHRDARSIFKLHIKEAFPDFARQPARDLTTEQVADMMRRLFDAEKGRTANKLRSYLRAAYEVARTAKTTATTPEAFKLFGISRNPVSETSPDHTSNNPNKRPLSHEELRLYWALLKDRTDMESAVLRVHLLTGSPRIAQLVRLRNIDVLEDQIKIFDGKGRSTRGARPHVLPLTKQAAQSLLDCAASGEFALSTDDGKTHVAPTTLSKWAIEIVGDKIADFQAKRLRSGVETVLAKSKVNKEVRGRLQSHGISGVQDSNYNAYEYFSEKLEALELLYKMLDGTAIESPSHS